MQITKYHGYKITWILMLCIKTMARLKFSQQNPLTMWYVNFTNDENIAFSQLALQILYAAQLYMRHG